VGVYLLDLKTGRQKFIVHADSGAQYANGYLLYLQRQNLMAQRFDSSRQQLVGSAQPLVEQIAYNGNFWSGAVSVSENLLTYMNEVPGVNRLTWFDRNGKEDESIELSGTPYIVYLSPDGTRAATQIGEANGRSEIRTFDLTRGGETKITPGVAAGDPIWTPDGKQITYVAVATHQIVNRASSGMGEPRVVVSVSGRLAPTSWSPDGKRLLYMNFNLGNGPRTYVHEDGREDYPLLKSDMENGEAQFSPDGKWIAFASHQTDRYEIYVVPFPSTSTQYQVSLQGGAQPRWSSDGKQLYFVAGDRHMMTVEVTASGETLKLGPPKPLFQTRIVRVFEGYTQFDVSPDGKRFLINTLANQNQQPIMVFSNWAEKLK
jgi:Tol biopolymer transport system component